jgi:hypothetical protein
LLLLLLLLLMLLLLWRRRLGCVVVNTRAFQMQRVPLRGGAQRGDSGGAGGGGGDRRGDVVRRDGHGRGLERVEAPAARPVHARGGADLLNAVDPHLESARFQPLSL